MTDDEFPDYYRLLKVDATASPDGIRRAFLAEVKFWHPDNFHGRLSEHVKRAERETAKLNEAWEVLRDPTKRREYDELLEEWHKSQADQYRGDSPDEAGDRKAAVQKGERVTHPIWEVLRDPTKRREYPELLEEWRKSQAHQSRGDSPDEAGDRKAAFQKGERVTHPMFGLGVVVDSTVAGDDEHVTVLFQGWEGIKRLSQSFARLTRVDETD